MATWKCGASASLPIGPDRAWDGPAAQARMFEWAGWEGDKGPSGGGKAKQGHGAYDSDAPDLKGSYKLPFADVVDGDLVAIPAGVRAAKSRASQSGTDLPQSVKDEFIDICDGYLDKADKGDGKKQHRAMDDLSLVTTLQVRAMDNGPTARGRTALVDKAKEHAPDPTVFDEHPPYFFQAIGSNSNVDSFGTQMQPSTLRNYAADWAEGRALLVAHVKNVLPLGHTMDGKYGDKRTPGGPLAIATSYIIPDLTVGGQNTSDAITSIRAGTAADVSVGFHGGRMVCSLCGRDMLDIFELIFGDYEREEVCPHIPGVMYAITDKYGKPTGEKEMAVGLIEDAHSAELSMAYEGATPGAAVLKGQRMAEAGWLDWPVLAQLETRYRMRLPGPRPNWPGADLATRQATTPQEDGAMSHAATGEPGAAAAGATTTTAPPAQAAPATPAEAATTATTATPAAAATTAPAAVTPERQLAGLQAAVIGAGLAEAGWQGDVQERIAWAGRELARLRPLADDGVAYREALIEETLTEGTRMHGNTFNREMYKGMLAGLPIANIRTMRDDFKTGADKVLAGGRQTTEGAGAGGTTTPAAAAAATNGTDTYKPPRAVHRG